MIQMSSVLDVADNSGAKQVYCIKVLGGSRRRYASIGDVVIVSVREAIPGAKVKKGEVARVVVEKINLVKRHSKPSQRSPEGGIIEKEGSVAISNVAIWDEKAGRGTRTKVAVEAGKKVRVSVKTGVKIETR